MNKEMETALKRIGLSENEIKVYLANLELGISTASIISKKAGLIRTTCYELIESLIRKGMCSTILRENKKHFSAILPSELLSKLEENEELLKRVLPDLMALTKKEVSKSRVLHFEGKEGLKTILKDLFSTNNRIIRIMGSYKNFTEIFEYYTERHIKERVKKKIFLKAISELNEENKSIQKRDAKELRDLRLLKELKDPKSEVYIYGDKVALVSLLEGNIMGAIIENKQIAKIQEIMFDKIFSSIKKK